VRRHETDPVSLLAGLLFLVVAAVHVAARSTGTELNLRWMVPAVLVLLGVLGLLGAIRSPRGSIAEPAGPAEPVDEVALAEPAVSVEPVEPAVLDDAGEVSSDR
jgi:hypothetical protein